jgi:hypothetical protein
MKENDDEFLIILEIWDGNVGIPSSRRANLESRGVLKVRRSEVEMKCNAEIGFFTLPSEGEMK